MNGAQDERRLVHIHEAITLIEHRTRSGQDRFLNDVHEQDAVLWRLYTLADAAAQLSDELKARHSEIPWERVRGFRNIAAHGYLDLLAESAWEIIEIHLPVLKIIVERELESRGRHFE